MRRILLYAFVVAVPCGATRTPQEGGSSVPGAKMYNNVERETLSVDGSGMVTNSKIGTLDASGAVTITGSEVKKLDAAGAVTVTDSTIANVESSGSVTVKNSEISTLDASGAVEVEKSTVSRLHAYGGVSCHESQGKQFDVYGQLRICSCTVDTVNVYAEKNSGVSQPLIDACHNKINHIHIYEQRNVTPEVHLNQPKQKVHVVFHQQKGVVKTNTPDNVSVENGNITQL